MTQSHDGIPTRTCHYCGKQFPCMHPGSYKYVIVVSGKKKQYYCGYHHWVEETKHMKKPRRRMK